jgi:hypothetical protein
MVILAIFKSNAVTKQMYEELRKDINRLRYNLIELEV